MYCWTLFHQIKKLFPNQTVGFHRLAKHSLVSVWHFCCVHFKVRVIDFGRFLPLVVCRGQWWCGFRLKNNTLLVRQTYISHYRRICILQKEKPTIHWQYRRDWSYITFCKPAVSNFVSLCIFYHMLIVNVKCNNTLLLQSLLNYFHAGNLIESKYLYSWETR